MMEQKPGRWPSFISKVSFLKLTKLTFNFFHNVSFDGVINFNIIVVFNHQTTLLKRSTSLTSIFLKVFQAYNLPSKITTPSRIPHGHRSRGDFTTSNHEPTDCSDFRNFEGFTDNIASGFLQTQDQASLSWHPSISLITLVDDAAMRTNFSFISFRLLTCLWCGTNVRNPMTAASESFYRKVSDSLIAPTAEWTTLTRTPSTSILRSDAVKANRTCTSALMIAVTVNSPALRVSKRLSRLTRCVVDVVHRARWRSSPAARAAYLHKRQSGHPP